MAEEVSLHALGPGRGRHRAKRVGRGPGSGHGKTSGKGHKGQKARSGGAKGPGFEGGQMPLQMRVPKRGFTNARFRRRFQVVNLRRLADWPAGVPVTVAELARRRLVSASGGPVKLLGTGEPSGALVVEVDAVSAGARAKVEAAGGRVTVTARAANGSEPDEAGAGGRGAARRRRRDAEAAARPSTGSGSPPSRSARGTPRP